MRAGWRIAADDMGGVDPTIAGSRVSKDMEATLIATYTQFEYKSGV
jgi:hypothetical protein